MRDPEDVIWKPCLGLPHHQVSNDGRIRSLDRTYTDRSGARRFFAGQELKTTIIKGYRAVRISTTPGSPRRHVRIHILVCAAFHGPKPDGMQVRHLNGDPLDNRPENLAWGTQSENIQDAVRHGTHRQTAKTHCPQGHPYSGENLDVESNGRRCRTCRRAQNAARNRDYRARKKAAQR